MSKLVPCVVCRRHVRVDACECPFCGSAREARSPAPEARSVPARLGSLAVMTFRVAALGVALNACGEADLPPGPVEEGGSSPGGATQTGTAGTGDTGAGATTNNGSGGSGASTVGGTSASGAGAGPVPVYRATPRG